MHVKPSQQTGRIPQDRGRGSVRTIPKPRTTTSATASTARASAAADANGAAADPNGPLCTPGAGVRAGARIACEPRRPRTGRRWSTAYRTHREAASDGAGSPEVVPAAGERTSAVNWALRVDPVLVRQLWS